MQRAATILELRGFGNLPTELAKDMDDVAVTPERVRAGIIHIVESLVQRCREVVPLVRSEHIGGDTWFFESENLEVGIQFGVLLLRTIETKAKEGFYFLKPSLSTRIAEPKLLQARFLDDESIAAYRAADKGFPFRYVMVRTSAHARDATRSLIVAYPRIVPFGRTPAEQVTTGIVSYRPANAGRVPTSVAAEVVRQ